MKSKFKSLFFWGTFFFLLICLMFWGVFFFINTGNLYYFMGRIVEILGYLFIAVYVVLTILIFTHKFPERIKRFEKFRYLGVMVLLILIEIFVIASAFPDLD